MSLNKSRKRLIKKYHKMFNSHPIVLKFSTDGGKSFTSMGKIVESYIPDASAIKSGNISTSKLSAGEFSFRNFEITISQGFSKEEFNELNGGVL